MQSAVSCEVWVFFFQPGTVAVCVQAPICYRTGTGRRETKSCFPLNSCLDPEYSHGTNSGVAGHRNHVPSLQAEQLICIGSS